MFKPLQIIGITSILLLGTTACTSNEPNTPAESLQASISAAPTAEKGASFISPTTIAIADEMKFDNGNLLTIQENEKITVTSYGTPDTAVLEKDGESKKPSEGEVFHAINYTSSLNSEAKASVSVDGKQIPFKDKLSPQGAIIVSAPEGAKITLNIERLGITQSIDFKTATRTTTGVADVWYKETVATLGNPVVSETFLIQGKNVKLDYSVTGATRTAYDTEGKWADDGKSSWVIVDGKKPKWTIPDNGGTDNVTQKFTLKDAAGKEYPPVESKDPGGDALHLEFKVPSNIDAFLLKLDSSTDITYFGETQGTAAITSEKVQITFTPRVTPSATPSASATATGSQPATSSPTVKPSPVPTASPTASR